MNKEDVQGLVQGLIIFCRKNNVSRKDLAERLNIPYKTIEKWFAKEESRRMPHPSRVKIIRDFLESEGAAFSSSSKETTLRVEKIRHLLLLLSYELSFFRDGSKEQREVLRKYLDFNDAGYLSSILTMLGDEDKFKRWLTLSTSRFNFFRKKGEKK